MPPCADCVAVHSFVLYLRGPHSGVVLFPMACWFRTAGELKAYSGRNLIYAGRPTCPFLPMPLFPLLMSPLNVPWCVGQDLLVVPSYLRSAPENHVLPCVKRGRRGGFRTSSFVDRDVL